MKRYEKRVDDLEDAIKVQAGSYRVVYINGPTEPGNHVVSDEELAAMDDGLTTLIVVEYVEGSSFVY